MERMEKIRMICEDLMTITEPYQFIITAAKLMEYNDLDENEKKLMCWNVFAILSDEFADIMWDESNIAIKQIHDEIDGK